MKFIEIKGAYRIDTDKYFRLLRVGESGCFSIVSKKIEDYVGVKTVEISDKFPAK